MIHRAKILLAASLSLVCAQNSEYSLVGEWIFESMTTITKAEREEITIVYNDENNLETLSFENSVKTPKINAVNTISFLSIP